MGRGAYDLTDARNSQSSAAQTAIDEYHARQAKAEHEAEVQKAMEEKAKTLRSKKSRGIMAARQEAKRHAQGDKNQSTSQ